jgi:hypothetical protein
LHLIFLFMYFWIFFNSVPPLPTTRLYHCEDDLTSFKNIPKSIFVLFSLWMLNHYIYYNQKNHDWAKSLSPNLALTHIVSSKKHPTHNNSQLCQCGVQTTVAPSKLHMCTTLSIVNDIFTNILGLILNYNQIVVTSN